MKKTLATIALVVVAVLGNYFAERSPSDDTPASHRPATGAVAAAFASKRSNLVLEDAGRVIKTLPDDLDGSRHQRILLDMGSSTLLIAHNIDLAPRIQGLEPGDQIRFKGEYEYNNKGGVVHWTHHDPQGRHEGGYLEFQGRRYQ